MEAFIGFAARFPLKCSTADLWVCHISLNSRLTQTTEALVRDTHPKLRKEWHPTRNRGLSFDTLRTNSGTNVWWLCAKDPRHEWQADIRRRAVRGNGCPYCSGLRVLREASFAALYPKLAAEWHPTLNDEIDPWRLAPMSNRRVWWQCHTIHKHVWSTQLHSRTIYGSGCRQCFNLRNPLSAAAPTIAEEWPPALNGVLTPEAIAASSRKHVWWRCRNNPAHEWQASVDVRVRGNTRCPECAKLIPREKLPFLNVYNPGLVAQWHPTRNAGRRAADFLPNSTFKAWWICSSNPAHVWPALIRNRAMLRQGCPHCAPRTKLVSPGKSFAERFPNLALEWHPTKNGSLRPTDVLPGSSKRVWWQCRNHAEHVWHATITTRTDPRARRQCPFCSGSRVTAENSLLGCHPEIAKQWDNERNRPLTSATVKRASARNVWWICAKDSSHRWQARVKNRTLHQTGCPVCDSEERVRRLQHVLVESASANVDYFKTFTVSMEALRALAKRPLPNYRKLQQIFNRMLYASAITAMETYLSDAFIQNVIGDDVRMARLLKSAPGLKDRKFSVSELLEWKERATDYVSEYLLDIVWHNLAKIRQLYMNVLDVQFPEDATDVHRAVAVRHDLVHRNGRTKSGLVHRFKQAEIIFVFSAVERFVQAIDDQLQNAHDVSSE